MVSPNVRRRGTLDGVSFFVAKKLNNARFDDKVPPAKMSLIDYSTFSMEQLLANRTAIDKMIMSLSAAPAPATALKSKGGAWSAWTKKCMADHPAEVKAFQDAAERKVGAHLKWMSINKGKTSPEWLAFKAQWDSKGDTKTPESHEDEAIGLKVFMVDGQQYMRLWNSHTNDWAAILLR